MLSNEQKAKNLKLAYNKTGTLTSDLFNELVTLITKSSNVTSSMSAEQIRDALASLEGLSRLDASAIKNISSSVTVTIGTAEVSLQDIVQQILFDVNQLEDDSHTHANQSVLDTITDAEDGSKFLNDAGEYSLVDWLSIANKPTEFPPEAHTHTVSDISDFPVNVSHFNNNGDGSSPYDTAANVDAKLALKQYLDTGVITGLDIVINPLDDTKVDILPGLYVISDWSDAENPVMLVKHLTSTISGITPQFLNTHPASYIALDADFTPVQFNTQFTNEHRRPYCIIGAAIHSNLTTVNVVNQIKAPIVGPINQIHDTIRAIGRINLSGNEYTAAGSGLTINRSAGQIFGLGINCNDWLNPHVKSLAAELTVSFRYRLRSTSLLNGESADTTLINPNQWDNAGVLDTVPNNKFTIQRINVFQTGLTRIQRPQTIYDSMEDAKTLMQTENFVTEPNIADNSIFRAFLIIKKGVANLTAAIAAEDAAFIPVDKFGNVIGGAGVTLTSAAIIAALGFTPENVANKATDFSVINDTLYPSVEAVKEQLDLKLDKDNIAGVERVYTINTDGRQGTKPTSEFKDVLEYANLAAFPATGETGKIYLALDTNKTYRWSGSAYVQVGGASSIPNLWLVDKLPKVASNNFTQTPLLGGNFYGGSSPTASSFKTMLGVGIMSGTNANGGGRYLIEPANALRVTQGLSFYGCFYLGQTSRDNYIRIGFLTSQLNTTAVINGVWLQINTATATLNTADNSVTSQSAGATLSPGTYYEFLIECVTTSSVTCKIKEVLTGTVVFNQTLSTNVPNSTRTFQCGLVASITTAGASNTIISIQELSFGIKPDYLKNF